MKERRIHRLEHQIKARVAEVLQREIADPRLGFVTVSGVELDRECKLCKIYWSVLGNDTQQKLSAQALDRATGFVRRSIAEILHIRSVPAVRFVFDESIEGAVRIQNMLQELATERQQRSPEAAGTEQPQEDGDTTT